MFKLFFNRITKICLFASLIFPIYSHAQRASYSYVDSVVAVVNNDIITRSELNKRM